MQDQPLHSDVCRLWCFAPSDFAALSSEITHRYRWARTCEISEPLRPRWSRNIPGRAFSLCESYGEYNGCLGFPSWTEDEANVQGLERAYHKKYPKWSSEKIRRAIQNIVDHSTRSNSFHQTDGGRLPIQEEDILGFLNALCAAGPAKLLLDDGGTANIGLGGTAGLSDAHRKPISDETININLNAKPIRQSILIRYWTFHTISRSGKNGDVPIVFGTGFAPFLPRTIRLSSWQGSRDGQDQGDQPQTS